LHFLLNNVCTNAPQCYVIRTLPLLFRLPSSSLPGSRTCLQLLAPYRGLSDQILKQSARWLLFSCRALRNDKRNTRYLRATDHILTLCLKSKRWQNPQYHNSDALKVCILDIPAVSTLTCEAGVTGTKGMRVANMHAPFLRSKGSGNERSGTSLLHAF